MAIASRARAALLRVHLILDGRHAGDVEGVHLALLAQEHGDAVAQRMTHAEFVVHVRIGRREIDDGDVGFGDLLDHPLVDEAGALDIVRADASDVDPSFPKALDAWLDDARVNLC